jgi:hypothetical protein
MNSDPVRGVTSSLVKDYLKRSNHVKLSRSLDCEPCLDLQGLSLELLYNHFKPKKTFHGNTDIQEKSYIELVSLKSSFQQQIGDLRPLESESEMDKIVSYILSKNVQTFYLNLIVTTNQLSKDPSIRHKYPTIKFRRFTSCKGGEIEVITKAWERLMIKAKINEPQKVAEEIMAINSSRCKASKWRLVVIGSYLSRNLPSIRHAVEVLTVTLNTIYPKHTVGSYTQEEDELILNEVEQHGANPDTWHRLRIKLNRVLIQRRYNIIANRSSKKSGQWNLIECKALIDCMFPEAKLKTVKYINTIAGMDIVNSEASKCINRTDRKITKHWNTFLKSILLRFHYGLLSTPWKYKFLKYLVKNKIMGLQEINYDQVANKFPGIVSGLVGSWVPSLDTLSAGKFKGEPLFKIAEACMPRYKNRPVCGKSALQFREEIIKHYSENI